MKKDIILHENSELEKQIIDLSLINNIKQANLYIDYLNTKIKFYEKQIVILEQQKNNIFKRLKVKKYNNEISSYKEKIKATYNKLKQEMNLIVQIYKNIK